MKEIKIGILGLALIGALAMPTFAVDLMSANKLVRLWQSYKTIRVQRVQAELTKIEGNMNAAYFIGYVQGVHDDLVANHRDLYDALEGTEIDQICQVVGKYLEANPEKWHRDPASFLVEDALRKSFLKNASRVP